MVLFSPFLQAQSVDEALSQFEAVYQQQLGSTKGCQHPTANNFSVCSDALRNDGNAPFILHHGQPTDKVIVLFHGLSDSPFFLRSIAQAFYQQGNNVVVGLLAGHGLKQADGDMEDPELANRWRKNVTDIMHIAPQLGKHMYIGGFSTGGALAAEYALLHAEKLSGLLLFSGALRLESKAETLANVWGMRWLAKQLDGDYATQGRNPFKYPAVSTFAAFQLVDVIHSIRALVAKKVSLDLPIFVAHSDADTTTLIQGVEDLMAYNQGTNQFFEIPQTYDVCHADVVVSEQQLIDMQYDITGLEEVGPCSVPKANPLHPAMLEAALRYLQEN